MSNLLTETLNRIKEEVRSADRVVWCWHSWMEIKNIGSEGFKLASVQKAWIPRLELLPLVSRKDVLVDSRRSTQTNKFVPFNVEFKVPIEDSWIDLLNKHGEFGMVKLDSLETDITNAHRVEEIMKMLLAGFVGGRLQDLPAYWGAESPVLGEFENLTVRVKGNAVTRLSDLLAAGKITQKECNAFQLALPELARSAVIAHRKALSPVNGILPKSIEGVNTGEKPRFDATDNWIIREFPDFNATSRLSKKSEGDAIQRLATVLASTIAQQQPQQPQQPTAVEPFDLNLSVEEDPNSVPLSMNDEIPEFTLPSEVKPESTTNQIEDLLATSNNVPTVSDFGQCRAQTVAGGQCQNKAVNANGACPVLAHQKQLAGASVAGE